MKINFLSVVMVLVFLTLPVLSTRAEDMRDVNVEARRIRQELINKASAEKREAERAAAESRTRILNDRAALTEAVADLETKKRKLAEDIERLESEAAGLNVREEELSGQLLETDSVIRELVGVIRIDAKEIAALIAQNPQWAMDDPPTPFLESIAGEENFPGMNDIRRMSEILQGEIRKTGEVFAGKGRIVDRSGRETEAEILMLGSFTAAYRLGDEEGFLNYSPASRKLFALSKLPSRDLRKKISRYLDGRSEDAPVDVSHGGALSQLVHRLSLWEQLPKGGPIMLPIGAIGILGFLLILERSLFFLRKRCDGDGLLQTVAGLASARQWEACREAVARFRGRPVAEVLASGLDCRDLSREDMESALQETILKEMPATERFLSTLAMLAAIAPLLGLLGTVTGMINLFHMITQYGNSDPRMMSGGISEALLTTMLGLAVAIPLLFAHTLLSRKADNLIDQMEEKAVTVINILQKTRLGA